MCYVVLGEMTTGGITGGSIFLILLIAGFVLSILWNKGMLPRTRYAVSGEGSHRG